MCVCRVGVGTSLKIKWLVIKREFRFFTTNFKTPAYGNFTQSPVVDHEMQEALAMIYSQCNQKYEESAVFDSVIISQL